MGRLFFDKNLDTLCEPIPEQEFQDQNFAFDNLFTVPFMIADRGSCSFAKKVKNMEDAGVAVGIVVDNTDENTFLQAFKKLIRVSLKFESLGSVWFSGRCTNYVITTLPPHSHTHCSLTSYCQTPHRSFQAGVQPSRLGPHHHRPQHSRSLHYHLNHLK